MHFYEASIITTKDGLHCQVYGNEHPMNSIIVKPKYIPTDKIESDALQYRFLSGKRMNRLNMWSDNKKLKEYLEKFKKAYPDYVLKSDVYEEKRLIFSVPIDKIERVYFPKRGFSELMKIPKSHLDKHLILIHELGNFLLKSGLSMDDIGITYSTLVGHYLSEKSDINIVIYGKNNFWKLMDYLKTAKHPLLRWKTSEEWLNFRKRRNRHQVFSENEFLGLMLDKKSEGFFGNALFIIFCAEKENETWFKWGDEKYTQIGLVKIKAIVEDSFSSIARPGMYKIKNAKIISNANGISYDEKKIKQIIFYSRDYCMLANQGDKIEACGILEEVSSKNGKHYRICVGYFDAYLDGRINYEYIKPILDKSKIDCLLKRKKQDHNQINKFSEEICAFCREQKLDVGEKTEYGARIIYKIGDNDDGWFAILSPKTAGNAEQDFSIQLIPLKHLRYFSEINSSVELAKNYGILFAKISNAISKVMIEETREKNDVMLSDANLNSQIIPIASYGKCKHPDEHIHIKLFPYRGDVGQPFTVDSTYENKEIFKDKITGEEFIKMKPVKKKIIPEQRIQELAQKLIKICNEDAQ